MSTSESADPRRKVILDRLERLHIKDMSDRELQKVLGIDRATWGRIEAGESGVRSSSYTKALSGLDAWEHEHQLEQSEAEAATLAVSPDMVELTVSIGALDWSATVRGPKDSAEVLQRQLAELMARAMREAQSK